MADPRGHAMCCGQAGIRGTNTRRDVPAHLEAPGQSRHVGRSKAQSGRPTRSSDEHSRWAYDAQLFATRRQEANAWFESLSWGTVTLSALWLSSIRPDPLHSAAHY